MSAMADLDAELSQFKLSDAQKNAVVEVFDQGWTTAKPNTIKSLENKGILVRVSETHHKLGSVLDDFLSEWQGAPSVADTVQAVQEVMFLGGESGDAVEDPSKIKLGLTSDAPMADWELQLMDVTRDQAERFDYSLGREINSLLGFGELYKWKNPKVWDGLTAKEIREDMDSAFYVNRAARRKGDKITKRFVKAISKVS